MKIIDVLGHQQELAGPLPIQFRQGFMRCIGLDSPKLAPALIVEALDQVRVAMERLGRRHVLHPVVLPESVGTAEGP